MRPIKVGCTNKVYYTHKENLGLSSDNGIIGWNSHQPRKD